MPSRPERSADLSSGCWSHADTTYVGPWLPEPVPTALVDTAEDVAARRESVTMAFLVLLETLTPAERAAFVLREVFDGDYADVAQVLDTSPAAARQLVHRAKERIAEGRPRFTAPPERRVRGRRRGAVGRLMTALWQKANAEASPTARTASRPFARSGTRKSSSGWPATCRLLTPSDAASAVFTIV